MKFGRIILQVRTQSDFLFDSHFHYDGGHDAVSRRKVLPSGECTCSAFPYRRVRQFLVWVHSRPTFVLISEHNFYIAVHIVQNVCLRLSVHLSAACNVELSVLIWVGLLRISKIVNGAVTAWCDHSFGVGVNSLNAFYTYSDVRYLLVSYIGCSECRLSWSVYGRSYTYSGRQPLLLQRPRGAIASPLCLLFTFMPWSLSYWWIFLLLFRL